MIKPIYLDHHATTPVDPEVLQAMLPFFSDDFGNPHSRSHLYGWTAEQAVETARQEVAQLMGATAHEIIFTSGATEANNLALVGSLGAQQKSNQPHHIITAATEHKSVLDTCKYLESTGCELTILPVDRFGQIDQESLKKAIKPHTKLISIMWANNEIGTLQPINEIGRIAKERGVIFHCDAVQGIGQLPINVDAVGIDLLSLSAHKIYGPKGIGALYVRRKNPRVELLPLFHGGGQERNLRSGTLNVPGIVGLGSAARLVQQKRDSDSISIGKLRDRLCTEIQNALKGTHLNGHPTQKISNNLNLSFEGVNGEALIAGLRSLAVSSGSACLEGQGTGSHVLSAIGVSKELMGASIRFGLGRKTTEEDITKTVATIVETVNQLRHRSQVKQFK